MLQLFRFYFLLAIYKSWIIENWMEEMEENFPIILQDNIEVKFHFSWRNVETIIRVEVVVVFKKSGVKSGIGIE